MTKRIPVLIISLGLFVSIHRANGFSQPPTQQSDSNNLRQLRLNLESSLRESDGGMKEADDGSISSGRRGMLQSVSLAAASALLPSFPVQAAEVAKVVPSPAFTSEVSWPLGKIAFSLLPLAGTSTRRATVEECIIPDTMWTHDQIQGVVNVNVPVRQTVIRLEDGGLWVHNPVAPTPQLLQKMKALEDKYGPVRHIVLGTVALEHKATFGAFCQNFPKATAWVQRKFNFLSLWLVALILWIVCFMNAANVFKISK